MLTQARSEASLYLDDLGRHTSSLSLEAQSSAVGRVAPDVMYSGRCDLRRKDTLLAGNKVRATCLASTAGKHDFFRKKFR